MNNQTKILLTIQGIPGGKVRCTGTRTIECKLTKRDLYPSYNNSDKNKVIRKNKVVIRILETVPCSKAIKMTQDAYSWMTSEESRLKDFSKSTWKKMSKKKRLEAHLSIVCECNNGTSFVYSILEE